MGAVFAERFNRTIRDLLERPVFGRGDANWIDVLSQITKQHNKRIQSSSKFSPTQASLKKKEGYVYNFLLDKKNTSKVPSKKSGTNSRFKKTSSRSVTTKRSYIFYKTTEKINDTIPSYHIDNLSERYNEAILKKTELTLKEKDKSLKKLNLN